MSDGRKRKPDALKELEGTARPDRMNPAAPEASTADPEETPLLTGRALWWFGVMKERVAEIRVASRTSSEALALAAMRLAEIEALTKDIETEGASYEAFTAQGGRMIRAHPAVSQRSEAMRHLQSLLSDFGLTPASLSKVNVNTQKESESTFAQIRRMK